MALGPFSYAGLILIVVAGFALWLGLSMLSRPYNFSISTIEREQWYALIVSFVMSVLWWLRQVLIFTDRRLTDPQE